MKTSRRSQVDPFLVMEVLSAAQEAEAEGRDVIHLEIGQPSIRPPQRAIEKLCEDLRRDPLGYTAALGLPALRARISRYYAERFDLDVPANRIVITSGASGAFVLAFTALFDPGDAVALPVPGYPSYRQILRAMSLEPASIEIDPFLDTLRLERAEEARKILGAARGLLLASPANPTGAVLSPEDMARIVATCHAEDISFISDEIYQDVGTPMRHSALAHSNDIYVVNSFSKHHAMTGWRVGWMVVPEAHVRTVERITQNMFICAPHAAQKLALYALEHPEFIETNSQVYTRNREVLRNALFDLDFHTISQADGAFYLYVNISHMSQDAMEFCKDLLAKTDIAITPGLDFDAEQGQDWVRFSYARSSDEIDAAIIRLKRYFGGANA